MKIFFDGTTLCGRDGGPGAGIEHYTAQLLAAMVQQIGNDELMIAVPQWCSKKRLADLIGNVPRVHAYPHFMPSIPFLGRHVILPLFGQILRPDVYFSPFGQLPFGWLSKRTVLTVHDVAIYDHPEWFSEETAQSFSTRMVVPWSLKRASQLICVSMRTQSRLHALFEETRAKTSVVYEGVEMGHYKEIEHVHRFPFDRDYVLCLGTVEPRKNLVHAFRAFERLLRTHPELARSVRLVAAGKMGWKTKETEETAAAINHTWKQECPEGIVRFIGSVTEEEKWYLLSRAAGLLFPSYEEGFGLPVLEAMSVGTPVITTRGGALEEVAGDAAILVDPDDLVGISLAIAQCLLVPEGLQELREQGYRRASQFSWERCATQTLEILRSVAKKS